MSRVDFYGVDLSLKDIHNMCQFNELTYEYSGEIKDGDLKMLDTSIRLEYPIPPLVFCRKTAKCGSVVIGNKLVATIDKFVTTDSYKRLEQEKWFKPLHVIIVDSVSPKDIANIKRLYGRFVI